MRSVLPIVVVAALLLGALWRIGVERGGRARAESNEATTSLPLAPLEPATLEDAASDAARVDVAKEPRAARPTSSAPTAAAMAPSKRGTIFGSVRLARGGAPISLAVRVSDELGRTCSLARDGADYATEAPAPGHYWLRVRSDGCRPAFGEVELGLDEKARVDLVLEERLVLSVRLQTPDGRAFVPTGVDEAAHLWATALPQPLVGWLFELDSVVWSSEERGRYVPIDGRVTSDLLGHLELPDDPPRYVGLCLGQRVLATTPVAPTSTEVIFRLEPWEESPLASLKVHVRDERGEPPADSSVILSAGESVSAKQGADSLFEQLAPGRAELLVFSTDFAGELLEILLAPGANEVEVRLGEARHIRGRLRAERSSASLSSDRDSEAPAIHFGRLTIDDPRPRWDETIHFGVGPDAEFDFPVAPGLYALQVHSPVPGPLVRVDVREASVEDVELEVRTAHTLVLRRTSGAWQGVRYEFLDESGLAAAAGVFTGPEPFELVLPRGDYRLKTHLADGTVLVDTPFMLAHDSELLSVGW